MSPSLVRRLFGGSDDDPEPVSELRSKRVMARLSFGDKERRIAIRATYLATVQDTSVLVPKAAREDSTGRTHLTDDIGQGNTYEVALRLDDPPTRSTATWRRDNIVRFKGYLNSRNHITIPKAVREEYDIKDGDTVQIAIAGREFDPEEEQQSYVPEYYRL